MDTVMMRKCVRVIAVIPTTIFICLISLLLIFYFGNEDIRWQLMTLSEGIALGIITIDIFYFMMITEKMKFLME